jgi:hypothetical protein
MRIYLAGFSQGVAFDKGTQALNYLDFRKENGATFRVQVPEDALQAVIQAVYEDGEGLDTGPEPEGIEEAEERWATEMSKEEDPDPRRRPTEATVFGDDSDEPDAVLVPQEQYPESEDEVPSL